MLKNNKFFVIFLIFLFSVVFCCNSVFATVVTEPNTGKFSFTGFNGSYYEVQSLPPGVSDYAHYVMVEHKSIIYIYCFNNSLDVDWATDLSWMSLDGDLGEMGYMFSYSAESGIWVDMGNRTKYMFNDHPIIIYSCFDLLEYKNYFNSNEDFFYNPPTVELRGTLAPICQKIHLEEVVKEILEILPVILMTIVGLIGLRKALKFLSKVLHQS